jgi:hypothetical protein
MNTETKETEKEPLSRSEFWMRVAGASFGLWSLMIPLGVWMLNNTFDRVAHQQIDATGELVQFNRRFEAYVLNMERRVTIIEERQGRVLKELEEIDRLHILGRTK